MRVAIVGSRNASDTDISWIAAKLPDSCTRIISGGADGIDSFAELLADEKKIAFTEYKPDYARFGKRAPLMRNLEIIENADIVLAFWDFSSRGTAYTIAECLRRQIPVQVFPLKELVE